MRDQCSQGSPVHRAATAVLTLLLISGAGCAYHTERVGCYGEPDRRPRFSPDGQWLAYVYTDSLQFVPIPLPYTPQVSLASGAEVRWCRTDRPDEVHSVKVDWRGAKGGATSLDARIVFSPDSRRIAAVGEHRLSVIEVQSGERKILSERDETVTSLWWTSPDEIAYAAHTRIRDQGEPQFFPGFFKVADRTIWRQKIHEPPESRTAVFSEKNVQTATAAQYGQWPLERPSPDGRYVVFQSPMSVVFPLEGGPFKLLDVRTGHVRTVGTGSSTGGFISWKPDSSAILVAGRALRPKGRKQVFVVDPASGDRLDVCQQFTEAFDHAPVWIEPLWTADGEYVVVTMSDQGGCLVRPEPWEVIPVVQDFVQRTAIYPLGDPEREWWLYRTPIAGWVMLDNGSDRTHYLVNYANRSYVSLENMFRCSWAWSSDGESTAKVGDQWEEDEWQFTVRHMDLNTLAQPIPEAPSLEK